MFVVGHPGHRRIALLQQARARAGLAPAAVVAWRDLLADVGALRAAVGTVVRPCIKIDSAGEDAACTQALVAHGRRLRGDAGDAPDRVHGELAARDDWYAGFADLLARIEASVADLAPRWLNPPAAILRMGDKLGCQRHLAAAGIAVPALLGAIDGYDDLRARLDASGHDRVFVKARYGSSAAGVVAYRRRRDGRESAVSSAALVHERGARRIVNRLKPTRLEDGRAIAALVDALARQGSYVEQWLTKPSVPGQRALAWDARVLVTAGRARQRVARMAAGPLTNLHLGNRRGDLAAWLDSGAMRALEAAAERAAASFAYAGCVGLDLVQRRDRVHLLEANAFGDLLPGLRWRGRDSYDDQARWAAAGAALPDAGPVHA